MNAHGSQLRVHHPVAVPVRDALATACCHVSCKQALLLHARHKRLCRIINMLTQNLHNAPLLPAAGVLAAPCSPPGHLYAAVLAG